MNERVIYPSYRWAILASVSIAIISLYIDMIAYAPILGEIAKQLSIDMGTATYLMMGFVVAVALILIWGGVVCDKYGITTALVLGLLCASVPAALMPLIGTSYGTVFVCRLIQGASVGFIFATIGPILALYFPQKEQGLAGGVLVGSLSLGSAIGVVISPTLFGFTGSWQTTVAILSLPGWASIIFALAFTRKPPSPEVVKAVTEGMQADQGGVTFGEVLCLPITWIGSFLIFFNAWALYCLYNLVPAFLAAPFPMGLGYGPTVAGRISLVLTIVGLLATVVGGIFFDKVVKGKSRPAAIIGFVLSGLFTYLLLLPGVSGSMALLLMCLLIAGWGIPFMGPSLTAFIAMNYPPGMVGRLVGWWYGFGTFGGAAGLYLGGITIGASGKFTLAITMISMATVIGTLLSFFLKPRKI